MHLRRIKLIQYPPIVSLAPLGRHTLTFPSNDTAGIAAASMLACAAAGADVVDVAIDSM